MSLEDLFDETERSYFPLTVVRVYSAYIHKRRSTGPMGSGWLLNFWYICCVFTFNHFFSMGRETGIVSHGTCISPQFFCVYRTFYACMPCNSYDTKSSYVYRWNIYLYNDLTRILFQRELHIDNVTEENITLWKQRESIVFQRSDDDESYYVSESESMTIAPEGMFAVQWNLSIMVTVLAGHLLNNSQGSQYQNGL